MTSFHPVPSFRAAIHLVSTLLVISGMGCARQQSEKLFPVLSAGPRGDRVSAPTVVSTAAAADTQASIAVDSTGAARVATRSMLEEGRTVSARKLDASDSLAIVAGFGPPEIVLTPNGVLCIFPINVAGYLVRESAAAPSRRRFVSAAEVSSTNYLVRREGNQWSARAASRGGFVFPVALTSQRDVISLSVSDWAIMERLEKATMTAGRSK